MRAAPSQQETCLGAQTVKLSWTTLTELSEMNNTEETIMSHAEWELYWGVFTSVVNMYLRLWSLLLQESWLSTTDSKLYIVMESMHWHQENWLGERTGYYEFLLEYSWKYVIQSENCYDRHTWRISLARLMLFLEISNALITAALAKPSLQRWLIWSTLMFS